MPALVADIHVSLTVSEGVDGRDIRAFTPVFDGLCPAMTEIEGRDDALPELRKS
jgi:hypothetical protein